MMKLLKFLTLSIQHIDERDGFNHFQKKKKRLHWLIQDIGRGGDDII